MLALAAVSPRHTGMHSPLDRALFGGSFIKIVTLDYSTAFDTIYFTHIGLLDLTSIEQLSVVTIHGVGIVESQHQFDIHDVFRECRVASLRQIRINHR